ncbi:MAG: GNAT family N-acetyltransferase [Armatimonadetes bacterium]|nr:GNAT family N-acetyltransferase [Armatimonadota bacterium]
MEEAAEIAAVFGDLPVLETQRLLLRKLILEDVPDVFAYASDPEVARFTTWEAHQTIDDSRRFLEWVAEQYVTFQVAPWGVVHKGGRRIIGTCGYMWWRPGHARAEIAYAIGRNYWNQGLTTEAVREVIRFGFERMRLNRIEARCMVENVASERVMQKAGMTFEGVLREQMYVKGRYDDLKLYSILKREYEAAGVGAAVRDAVRR